MGGSSVHSGRGTSRTTDRSNGRSRELGSDVHYLARTGGPGSRPILPLSRATALAPGQRLRSDLEGGYCVERASRPAALALDWLIYVGLGWEHWG
jgi:hypothetical protein